MNRVKMRMAGMVLLALIALLFQAASAFAAEPVAKSPAVTAGNSDIYLKLDGIKGDATTKGLEGYIKVNDLAFGASQIGASAGTGSGAGKAVISDITFTKGFDSASIPLFLSVVNGKAIKSAEFVLTTRGSSAPYLRIQLSDVIISQYSFSDATESVGLSFAKIMLSYTKDGKSSTGGWDLKKNQAAN